MESFDDSHSDQLHSSSWDSQKQGTGSSGGGSCSNFVDTEFLQPYSGNIEQRRHYAENILQDEQVKPNDTVTATPYFLQLPNEILVRIICYALQPTGRHSDFEISSHPFYQLGNNPYARQRQLNIYTWALVSKQFYAIANPLLWKEPVLGRVCSNFEETRRMQQLLDGLLVTQQPLGNYVRKLVLFDSFCSDTDILLLIPYIRRVETLTIQNVRFSPDIPPITSKSVQDVPQHCPHLTSLTRSNILLSDASIQAIGQHCHQLKDLTLTDCDGLWDIMFGALSSCPLEKIHLTDGDWKGAFPANMARVLTSFKGLTHLTLDGTASLSRAMTIASNNSPHGNNKDKKERTTAVFWPHLKVIDFKHCYLDDTTWTRFVQAHPHLVSLQLSTTFLTDASLDAMAVCLGDLSSLVFTNMNAISADGVRRLIQNCKRLVSASFHQCDQILSGDFGKPGCNISSVHLDKREMDNMRRVKSGN